ncbi:MAG: hypothetical protein AB7O26_11610 [Planctomycetaceae bacterium]
MNSPIRVQACRSGAAVLDAKRRIAAPAIRYAALSLVAICSGLFSSAAYGIGAESTTDSNDLNITVDSRWAGVSDGGYFPIRVRVVNRGEPRELTFRYSSMTAGGAVPTVRRRVTAEQNATVRFTLAIPIVSSMNFGSLEVFDDSRLLKAHTRQVPLPDMRYNYGYGSPVQQPPSLLAISSTPIDFARFESGMHARFAKSVPGYAGGSVQTDCMVVPPSSLPDSWIDYSGVDLVAVSHSDLAALPSTTRTAIASWVHCGGNLVVHGVPVAKREDLSKLLEFEKHGMAQKQWVPANPSNRQFVVVPPEQVNRGGYNPIPAVVEQHEESTGIFAWPASTDTFASRELMLGSVHAFVDNPFPGSAHDWVWFLGSIGDDKIQWKSRTGLSARVGTREFLDFLNPGVRGVPTSMFMVLITLFAVVIGPVNYFLLMRKRRLYLLLLTVPSIAFVTSAALVGYSTISHGFGVKSRLRSLTLLDQPARTSVTLARLALYAGLAPSGGLKFSADTAVYPVWPNDMEFESGTVDWTDTQNLESGWLRSRVHTQFLTTSHQAARGRLDVQTPAAEKLEVANGHEMELESLLVADAKGELYVGNAIPAGAAATLKRATPEDMAPIREVLLSNQPEPPEGADQSEELDFFRQMRGRPRRFYGVPMPGAADARGPMANGTLETRIRNLQQISSKDGMHPRSYLAIVRENPAVETGLTRTTAEAGYHLIVGYY